MSEWIDINLPWYVWNKEYIEPPNISQKEKEFFGTSLGEEYNKLGKNDAFAFEDAENKLRKKNKAQLPYMSEELFQLIEKENPDSKPINRFINYRRFILKHDEWYNQQPEIIAWKKELKAKEQEVNQKSFQGRELNKPGTLIEIQTEAEAEAETKQYLIGNISPNGGVSDDAVFSDETIVLRYKIVWKPNQ